LDAYGFLLVVGKSDEYMLDGLTFDERPRSAKKSLEPLPAAGAMSCAPEGPSTRIHLARQMSHLLSAATR
jgi:hypothetical protein